MSILDKFRLDGKTALVTGCKRGIGRAMALGLAQAGADLIGVSATLELQNSEVEREIRALGRDFKAYACDFSDRTALHQFIAQVKGDFPVIDILVNNKAAKAWRKSPNALATDFIRACKLSEGARGSCLFSGAHRLTIQAPNSPASFLWRAAY